MLGERVEVALTNLCHTNVTLRACVNVTSTEVVTVERVNTDCYVVSEISPHAIKKVILNHSSCRFIQKHPFPESP